MVLWRYNQLDPFKGAKPGFENIEVSGLSFHRAKGLEADYSILLDVSEGDYGVPSQIEDDELLNLVEDRVLLTDKDQMVASRDGDLARIRNPTSHGL